MVMWLSGTHETECVGLMNMYTKVTSHTRNRILFLTDVHTSWFQMGSWHCFSLSATPFISCRSAAITCHPSIHPSIHPNHTFYWFLIRDGLIPFLLPDTDPIPVCYYTYILLCFNSCILLSLYGCDMISIFVVKLFVKYEQTQTMKCHRTFFYSPVWQSVITEKELK